MQAKQTPRRNVLGEKTNKSPEKHHDDLPDGTSPQKGAGSPSKGTSSMRKNKSSAPTPFSGNQSYRTETDMGSVTPAPLRMLSRQSSFVTPAANIGRAGAIKARMGEMKDFEMGIGSGDPIGNVEAEQQGPQLTEEEMYPEIEYMPPSTYAHSKSPAWLLLAIFAEEYHAELSLTHRHHLAVQTHLMIFPPSSTVYHAHVRLALSSPPSAH